MLLYYIPFLLFGYALGYMVAVQPVGNQPPLRVQTPLSNAALELLPPYLSITAATIHYEYDGARGEVPQVAAELSAMQFIFQQYNFRVLDIAIPKSSDAAAQSFLESQISSILSGLSSLGSLAIIVYGGHGGPGGTWTANTLSGGSVSVDWKSIDTNIIAPSGVDVLQIIDSCYSGGFLPSTGEVSPASWGGRGAFSAITSASSENVAGVNQLAFTKAVINTLAPADGDIPSNFTASSLFDALPLPGVPFAQILRDTAMVNAMISDNYIPQFFELATSITLPLFKIAPLSCSTLPLPR
ncbi:hypothetical protein F5884DRAFT_491125 [Xylogone sp. PMI_703]|nr:hypothetical protein F5884DRAFT_491125 [Xylogone sp. PMI_703]